MEGLDPQTSRIMRGVSRLYREGSIEEGMAICRRVLEGDPENANAWHNLGHGYWKSGQIRKALRSNERALALWPDYPEAWNNRGVALGELGRLEESLECASRAVALGPRGWLRIYNQATAFERLCRFEEALHCYQRLRFLRPDSGPLREHHRETLEMYNSWRRNLRQAEEDIAADPTDPEAWHEKGFAQWQLGRLEESVASYDRFLELESTDESAWANRGMVLHELHRYREALGSLDRAIELCRATEDGEHYGTWHQKGLCLAALGERSAAVDCHARTVELNPDHPTAWFDKAYQEDHLGRLEEAEASYRRFLELEWPMYIGQKDWAGERLAELEQGDAGTIAAKHWSVNQKGGSSYA